MDLPGISDAMNDPAMMARASEENARLQEKLKESVQADLQDIGTLRKELRVTVPGEIISEHLEHNYGELRSDAIVPGFRRGHAPLQLVQKRFGAEVRESLKTTIIGQSFFAATEKHELKVLGDPRFRVKEDSGEKLMDLGEALEHLELPETGDFAYTCEVEVKPEFTLPDLKGIEIKNPQIDISDNDVSDYIERQRKIRGRFENTDRPASEDDMVTADVVLTCEDNEVKREENVQLGVRPTRLDGIPLEKLGEVLGGANVGDERSIDCTVPDDYERADLRGKPAKFAFQIREIKALKPVEIDQIVRQFGAEDEAELRKMIREDMELERDRLVQRAKKEQILDYLLEQAPFDLPEQLSARQTDRAVMRKVIELSQRGVPPTEIEQRIDELRTTAREETARDLKLEFIMEKVAAELEVSVTDEEVNSEIARMARLYGRRFDRVRDDLEKRGLLPQLAEQIRQDKCLTIMLGDAKQVDVAPEQGQ